MRQLYICKISLAYVQNIILRFTTVSIRLKYETNFLCTSDKIKIINL